MIPLNNVILSVNERAAYQTDSGIFLRADLGMAYDNIIQHGVVHATPKNNGLDVGDKVWFHHLLRDDDMSNVKQKEYNWDIDGVDNKAYVCPKELNGVGWHNRLLAKEKDGKLTALFGNTVAEYLLKEKSSELEVMDREEKHLFNVIDSDAGFSGKIIIRQDTDYPIEVNGKETAFIRPEHIVGTYNGDSPQPKEGFTFIEPIDEGGWSHNGIIWVAHKRTIPKGVGRVISTTSKHLKEGDEVYYLKIGFSRIKLENEEAFYAMSNSKILAKNVSE